MNFAEIEENINVLGEKARKNELAVEDMDREHSTLTTAACLAPCSAHPSLSPPHSRPFLPCMASSTELWPSMERTHQVDELCAKRWIFKAPSAPRSAPPTLEMLRIMGSSLTKS
ncbi:hypothetical protein ILYODFUR_029973 [Ilyodon furcidens]|uniref:Uncharacterized protein n=1 Tax=Ilyodon furcidens TaxID=33524 RepID=A0ABV0UBK7_9TELE